MQLNTFKLATLLVLVVWGNLLPAQNFSQIFNYQTLVNTAVSDNSLAQSFGGIPPGFIIGTIQETQSPANGALSFDSDPALFDTITYTPDLNFVGIDSAVLSCLLFDSSTINILLIYEVLLNASLNAVDDITSTTTNATINIDVLSNDLFVGQPSINILSPPLNGNAQIASFSTISYTSNAAFVGIDSFSYEIVDGAGSRDTAWVIVDVQSGGIQPNPGISQVYTYQTLVNTPVSDNSIAQGFGGLPAGFIIGTIQASQSPANGTLSFNADPLLFDSITYTPNLNFVGTDSAILSCMLIDSSIVNVLLIYEVLLNAALYAMDDFADVMENVASDIFVLDNDIFLGQVSVNIVAAPLHGNAQVNASSITYSPNQSYVGLDSLSYEIVDGVGSRDTAWVVLDIQAPAVPFITPATYTEENTTVLVDISQLLLFGLGNFAIYQAPTNGVASFSPSMDSLFYTPNPAFIGIDTILIEVVGTNYIVGAEVVVVPAGQFILLQDDYVSVLENSSITFSPLSNDQGNLSITNVTTPQNGQVVWTADSVTYTPNANFFGAEVIQYTACNANGVCETADIELSVSSSGAPFSVISLTTAQNSPLLISTSDTQAPAGLNFNITMPPSQGTLEFFPGDTTLFDSLGNPYVVYDLLVYTPNTGYLGMDSAFLEVLLPGFGLPLLECLLLIEVQDSSTFGFRLMNLYEMDPQTGSMTPMTGITSIDQDTEIEGVRFGPNPSNGRQARLSWQADANTAYSLSIRDMQGRLIWKEEDMRNGEADLSRVDVQTGVYMVELRADKKRWIAKWMVE